MSTSEMVDPLPAGPPLGPLPGINRAGWYIPGMSALDVEVPAAYYGRGDRPRSIPASGQVGA